MHRRRPHEARFLLNGSTIHQWQLRRNINSGADTGDKLETDNGFSEYSATGMRQSEAKRLDPDRGW